MTSSAAEPTAGSLVPDGLYSVHGELMASDAWLALEGWSAADLGDRPLPPALAPGEWDEWQELAEAPAPLGFAD